jgi:uncharacterized protein YaiL (DUF2058 family)
MSKTLQDQLVSLGLAKNKPSQRRKKSPGGSRSAKPSAQPSAKPHTAVAKKKPVDGDSISLEQAYRLKATDEKSAKERERQRKRAQDLERRQINTRIREIINAHALNDKSAELKRNFLYKGRIRTVLVTAEQRVAVNSGEIGIAYLAGRYYLLSAEHTELVRSIASDHVPGLGGSEPEDEDFPVPDDLVW